MAGNAVGTGAPRAAPKDPPKKQQDGGGGCGQCGAVQAVGGGKLRRCGRCLRMQYCCPEHQKSHWAAHKAECSPKAPG